MDSRTNDVLLSQLKSSHKADRESAVLYLYEIMFDNVKAYVQNNNGTPTEAEDVFHDSLMALYKSALADKLGGHINVVPYFFKICKNHWLRELQKKSRTVELNEQHRQLSDKNVQESILIRTEQNNLLDQLIQQLGDKCYKVLRLFYYEKRKMKEISKLLSLTNEQAAKNKKASCMKKLKGMIKSHPHILEILKQFRDERFLQP